MVEVFKVVHATESVPPAFSTRPFNPASAPPGPPAPLEPQQAFTAEATHELAGSKSEANSLHAGLSTDIT